MLSRFKAQRVILLQGPMGPFFHRLARELVSKGAVVTKVHFNAGDALFYRGADVVRFKRDPREWPAFFRELLRARQASAIFLFGDARPMHVAAKRVANELGVPVYVFEEGYLRPDHITLERGGVNKNSSMPRRLRDFPRGLDGVPSALPVGNTYWRMATFACCYSLALTFFGWLYPKYRHHKQLNAFYEAFAGIRSFLRWVVHSISERSVMERLETELRGKFFLVALQVHDDFQIKNSRFDGVPDFIREVVRSFAMRAPPSLTLVFKHHPLDRGYKDYGPLIRALARTHQLGDRLIYVHDLHLPTILRHAKGCVVLNSTVGLSALFHGTPVKVLDDAVYDIPGLTVDVPLDEFWTSNASVEAAAFQRVRNFMVLENQANGSFYRRLPGAGPSGILWPPRAFDDQQHPSASTHSSPPLERESNAGRPRHLSDVVPESQSPASS